MKGQITLAEIEYQNRRHSTKREKFLSKMDQVMPWDKLIELITPYYPNGKRGRPVRGIETMLRMYFLYTWFGQTAKSTEDMIYDSYSMRAFLGIDFLSEQVPNSTTLLRFKRILSKNKIEDELKEIVNNALQSSKLVLTKGKFVEPQVTTLSNFNKNKSNTKKKNK